MKITRENTWREIKTIILIKNMTAIMPHSNEFNNGTITDHTAMNNVFNNMKFSPKHYTRCLSNINTNTFFLNPTNKNEISFIISSVHSHKSSDPNSVPVKVTKK